VALLVIIVSMSFNIAIVVIAKTLFGLFPAKRKSTT
jgi:hypothetical protein